MSHSVEILDSDADRLHHQRRARVAGIEDERFEPPRSCHVVLRGRRYHYLDWGAPMAPTLVFLHGGGQTARTWDLICHALTVGARRRAIALDQRGHGDSEWSYEFDYAPDAHARDLLSLANHLELDRFGVVGMSMGCINGLRFALDHPSRLSSFVAVDAGPWLNRAGGQPIVEFIDENLELESIDAYVARALAFNARRDPVLLRQSLRHNLRQLPNGHWTWKTDWRRPRDFVARIEGELVRLQREVSQLACPLLVIRGAESEVFLDEHAERFASAVPQGRWRRVPNAGHTVQGDQPRALVAELERFLGDTHAP